MSRGLTRVETSRGMPSLRPRLAVCLFLGGIVALVAAGRAAAAAEAAKVVIPFDFVSKFDDGRYGRTVGELIWKRLERERGFIIPETMLDVRDTCSANNRHPSPERSMEEMGKIVRDDFGADIGIWGSVERVAGNEWDVYDLAIRCVDFTLRGGPKVVFECNVRTKTVSEIPDVYVQQMLDALYGRKPASPAPPNLLAEEHWRKNPNLVQGDFQRGQGGVPSGWAPYWEAGEVDQREPVGKAVRWIAESDDPTNRVIHFTLSKAVGDTTGVAYYSDFFPVEQGATYRFQCRWRSDGPKVKVFIKCYDELPAAGPSAASPGRSSSGRTETREVYRSQQNLTKPKDSPKNASSDTWYTHTEDFTPRHAQYTPRRGRVMLYAYVGAGEVEFDDVIVKQIVPVSPGDSKQ